MVIDKLITVNDVEIVGGHGFETNDEKEI